MSFFITLYTDASVRPLEHKTQVAWKGVCDQGKILGNKEVKFTKDTAIAELKAIREAICYSLVKFPKLEGFVINCDNIEAVRCFWPGKAIRPELEVVINEIVGIARHRWIKTRHVKAHTNSNTSRSHMNREVDKYTRSTPYKKIKENQK